MRSMAEGPTFPDLTIPLDGATLPRVMNLHARVLVRDFLHLPSKHLSPRTIELHTRCVAVARSILARDPPALARLLRVPTVQALLGAARRHGSAPQPRPELDAWVRELDLTFLLEASAQGALNDAVIVEQDDAWPRLLSPTLALALTPAEQPLRFGPDFRASAGLATETAYHPLWSNVQLAAADNNPIANVQAHPERPGNALDLGGRSIDDWTAPLREAFGLIDAHLPRIAHEMRQLLRLVVPVGVLDERHHSCSFEEAVGAIYLTLHRSPLTLAEALVHEFQHNKLNAVFRFDPLLEDAYDAVHASPVRPDPRHLHGILMAVHAFQPIALLYENLALAGHPLSMGHDWRRRFDDILRINAEGLRTVLAHGRPTRQGRALLDEAERWEAHFAPRRAITA